MFGDRQSTPRIRHWILWLLLLSGLAAPLFAQDGRGVSSIVPDQERQRFGFDAKASAALMMSANLDVVPFGAGYVNQLEFTLNELANFPQLVVRSTRSY